MGRGGARGWAAISPNRESHSSWLLGVSASGFYAWARRLSARISCGRWPPILVVLWIAWCGVKEMVVAASGGTDSSHDSLRFPARRPQKESVPVSTGSRLL